MSKAVGGLLRFLLAFLILAAVGYNFWQVQQLRAEVAALKRERGAASGRAERETPSSGPSALSAPLLRAAQRHAERAQEFLRRQMYGEARREIAMAAEALRESGAGANRESRDALASVRKAVESLSQQAGSLWEQDNNSGSGKNGQRTSAAKTESEKAR